MTGSDDSSGFPVPRDASRLAACWSEFNARFPTEADCIEELCQRSQGNSMCTCTYCGVELVNRRYGARMSKCQSCRRLTWHTAGTFFARIKTARAWLAAIWLMENGIVLSSTRLHTLLGIAQSTALNILQRIRTIIREQMKSDTSVSSAEFKDVFCKRSRMTPSSSHPRSEQDAFDMELLTASTNIDESFVAAELASDIAAKCFGRAGAQWKDCSLPVDERTPSQQRRRTEDTDSVVPSPSGSEKDVYELLSDNPISVDKLSELTRQSASELSANLVILELSTLAERRPGDCYVRGTALGAGANSHSKAHLNSQVTEQASLIKNIIAFIVDHHHGISRKYLQNYLAEYWYFLNRTVWFQADLLHLCQSSPMLAPNSVINFVSPLMVPMVLGSESGSE